MAIVQITIRQKENKIKTATGAVNYVLGMIDGRKNERSVVPKVVFGNPQLIKDYDRHPNMPAQNKSTSGVISFREDEKLDKQQEKDLIQLLQNTAIPKEYRGKVDMLVVKHLDKGNAEYHFIIPHLTNEGEKFNPWPVIGRDKGKTAIQTGRAITRLVNDTFGFEQVLRTRNSNGLNSTEVKIPNLQKTKRANQIAQALHNTVKQNNIHSRDQLITYLKSKGAEVTRSGQDYISIKQKGEAKAIRLSGGIFSANSTADYQRLYSQQIEKPQYTQADRKADIQTIKAFHSLVADRFEGKQHNQKELLKEFNQCLAQSNKLELKIEPQANKPIREEPIPSGRENKQEAEPTPTPTAPTPGTSQEQQQQVSGGGLGGQASGGSASAEAEAESAASDYSKAVAQYGPNSPQAMEAKARMVSAKLRALQAKQAEAQQQDQQNKRRNTGPK